MEGVHDAEALATATVHMNGTIQGLNTPPAGGVGLDFSKIRPASSYPATSTTTHQGGGPPPTPPTPPPAAMIGSQPGAIGPAPTMAPKFMPGSVKGGPPQGMYYGYTPQMRGPQIPK